MAGCLGGVGESTPRSTPAAEAFENVVDPAWLEGRIGGVKLLDVRDEDAFTDGHIPGAHRLPDTELMRDHYEETADGYEASPEVIADILADAGVTPSDDVIVYGEGSNLWETYAIYTLNAIGHEGAVSLLDGGYAFWTAADGAVETGTPEGETVTYAPEMNLDIIATRARVADNVDEDGADVQLVDNRRPAEYHGTETSDRAERHGHIPGAINLNFTQNLHGGGDRLRGRDDLERLWLEDAELDPTAETISYCTTAVRGSVGWFVMTQLGFENVRTYEGSWFDWGNLTEADGYPYASGPETGTVVDTFDG